MQKSLLVARNKLLITVPCYNEEQVLERTVFSIIEYASTHLNDYDWKTLILDNNSSDSTRRISEGLQAKNKEQIILDTVTVPGRGAALRESWGRQMGFDIYSYMDADLATDIKDFSFIIKKVSDGYDLVTGSRYILGSDVKRNIKREVLSRIYNVLIKIVLRVDFKDAQCGFKAMSRRLVEALIPDTRDSGWFFDTELMILASRRGYQVLEVPVSWREVRDEVRKSKVSHWKESLRQLDNIYRMYFRLKNGH